ncbi:MAG: hypothetical protein LBH34_06320 [Prevotellaceae bacterium]|nr:hypothetical protein [Prevotellaceae bacterium]
MSLLFIGFFGGYVGGKERKERADTTGKDFRNFLFLKLNKNKGYKEQAFENENAYALLEKQVSYVSFNVGFKSYDVDNYWLDPVAVVDDIYNRNFSASISLGYLVKNNFAVGLKAGYEFSDTRMRVNADLFDLLFSAKIYETNNVSTTFSGSVVLKNFIPLDRAHRLFLVNETGLIYSKTNSLAKNIFDSGSKINKIYRKKMTIGMGLSPGFMYFMTKGFAFEFALNPVIAYYEKVEITNNQVEEGSVSNYGLSFKFMPLNIQFGFAYYFGLDYYKNKKHVDSY